MFNFKLIYENISISLASIRSHLLRTVLTVLIIAFGIMALVGILTAIDAMKFFLHENFAMMGSNTFSLQNREVVVHIGGNRPHAKVYENVSYAQAKQFKEEYSFPSSVSMNTWGTGIATLKYESEKTNPNIQVMGIDENYLTTSGLELLKGRNITPDEALGGNHVAIIGTEIANMLFGKSVDAVGKVISVGPGKYKVIGVLEERGSSIGFSGDRYCLLPVANVRQYFSRPNMNFTINVMIHNQEDMDAAIGEATGLFRRIRQDKVGIDDSFTIVKSDNIANMLIGLNTNITVGATIIGLITLFGAAIGLMNIMLVSVTERTREIGIRKAVGATKRTIRNQFLVEAIVIAQFGGLFGIVIGVLIGNAVSMFTGSTFIMPWLWIIVGFTICFIVALLSGIVPANKAASLDPIEALRYE